MPFGDREEWRVRHDVPSDMDDATAAEYVRRRVEDGTDPVMSNPEAYRQSVRRAIASSGLTVDEDPQEFLDAVDTTRRERGESRTLDDIVHEALFGDKDVT